MLSLPASIVSSSSRSFDDKIAIEGGKIISQLNLKPNNLFNCVLCWIVLKNIEKAGGLREKKGLSCCEIGSNYKVN